MQTEIIGYYDYWIVALSVLLAMLGSYCAIELGGRVAAARGHSRAWWLMGGAVAMAIGTWSMHFVGMLAFRLPLPVQYDWPMTLLSWLCSFFASAVALFVVSRERMGYARALIGSVFMGGGISALHYIGMESMRLNAMCRYSPPLIVLSVIFAIGLSLASLGVMFFFRNAAVTFMRRKIASAFLLGAAIPIMHYTGMASVRYMPTAEMCDVSHAVTISTLGILGIAGVNVMTLVVVLVTSAVDRIQRQKSLLDELFEHAPDAVALLDLDQRIVRVNRAFGQLLGYDGRESVGRRIGELISPTEARADETKFAPTETHGDRVDAEVVLRRKDGSRLYVAMVRVPVALPHGRTLVYAIYRDITESKEAREALQKANEQLRVMSRRLLQVQEDEKRHLARELHDVMGQALTVVKISLQATQRLRDLPAIKRGLEQCLGIVDQLVQQTRQISLDLRPPLLDDLGLVPALRWYLDQQAQHTGFAVEFFSDPTLERLSAEIESACFRIAQEAITNVARHARAKKVIVELDRTPEALHLAVRDDGIGFDLPATLERTKQGGGLGLLGMRERVALVGGELDIKSAPGRGTEVHAFLPVPPPAPAAQLIQ